MKCEEHGCGLKYRYVGHGKTELICPMCEKDRTDILLSIFGEIDTSCTCSGFLGTPCDKDNCNSGCI